MTQLDELADELNAVAQRTLPRVFVSSRQDRPLKLPQLRSVADRVRPGNWGGNPTAALEVVLRLAIERLEGDYHAELNKKKAAYILFNMDAPELNVASIQFEGLEGKRYSHIMTELRAAAKELHNERGLAHPTNKLRLSLARIMLDPKFGKSAEAKTDSPEGDAALRLPPARDVMDEERSKQAIRDVLSETDEIAVHRLALLLNFDLPLVRAACEYLLTAGISIESGCRIIARDAGLFLDSLANHRRQPPVTRRVNEIVEELEREYPRVIAVLDLVSFLYHDYLSTEYISAHILVSSYVNLDEVDHAALIYNDTIVPLLAVDLLERDGIFVRMNPLVHSIIRIARKEKAAQVSSRLSSSGATEQSKPSAWNLMEAKWSPTASAARDLLDFILKERLRDQLYDDGRAAQVGKYSCAEWSILVDELRIRCFEMAAFMWVAAAGRRWGKRYLAKLEQGASRDLEDVEIDLQHFRDRFRIFEMEEAVDRSIEMFSVALREIFGAARDGENIEEAIVREFGKIITNIILNFHVDRVQSPLGELRFSDFFPAQRWREDPNDD